VGPTAGLGHRGEDEARAPDRIATQLIQARTPETVLLSASWLLVTSKNSLKSISSFFVQ
jgi:hypothetical protein